MANQIALITGASSGIGYNLARVFAENGFDLLVTAEQNDRLTKATSDFRAIGVSVTEIPADLATYDGVEQLWHKVEANGRPLDAVALNAGFGLGGLFAETELEKEIRMVRVNVESTMHLAKHVVQQMVGRGEGRILMTASIASEMVAPREAVYAATKAFVLSFAKSLRAELEDTGVTVTALQPGPVDTDFFHRAEMDDTDAGTKGKEESQPYDVAKQGFKALMDGDKHIYAASLKTKIEGAVAKPRSGRAEGQDARRHGKAAERKVGSTQA